MNAFVKGGNKKGTQEQLSVFFWLNIRENGGMRLTSQAHKYLTNELELENFEVDLRSKGINKRFLLELDGLLSCPYYLQGGRWPKIYLYDKEVFVWLIMLDTDWGRFLDSNKT